MKKRFHYGIRYEIVFNMTILAVVAIVLSALFTYKLLERHLLFQEIENAKMFSNGVRERLQFAIQKHNLSPIRNEVILQQVGQFFDVEFFRKITVVDVEGNSLAQITQGRGETQETVDGVLRDELLLSMRGRVSNIHIEGMFGQILGKSPMVTVLLPIIVQNRVWGGMAVSVELQGFRGVSGKVYPFFFAFMAVVTTVLAVFGSFIMAKLIVHPLLEIVQGTRKLSQGDLRARVEINAENELGELASSFNNMGQTIQEMINEREVHLIKLEAANEQLRKAQSDLVRSEKLAVLGRIAAGVAHEIGNPIGAILGYTEILKQSPLNAQESDFLVRIDKEAKRIDRMIRDLLDISRPNEERRLSPFSLKQTLGATIDLLRTQDLFRSLEIKLDLPPEDVLITADLHQLQQIIINLSVNAAQAMVGEGSLTVRLKTGIFNEYKHIPYQAGATFLPIAEQQPVIVLELEDTGPGLDEKIIGQVFEPFFTTRQPGQGTGLGLYIVSRLTEAMNGRIAIENAPKGGAIVTLLFPKEI